MTGVALAVFGERQIREARVLAGEAPRGFAVAGEIDGRRRFVRRIQLNFILDDLQLHEFEFGGNPSWQK